MNACERHASVETAMFRYTIGCGSTIKLLFVSLLFSYVLLPAASLGKGGKAKKKASRLPSREVVVYAYDSFTADWGPGPQLASLFEKQTGIKAVMISVGDTGLLLSRAVQEKKSPKADVLVGISNHLAEKARALDVLQPYKPKGAETVPQSLRLDKDWQLTPYDWSFFAFVYDTQSALDEPRSLADLTKPQYRGKIAMIDPRTSAVGLGFLAWTLAVYGDGYLDYWKQLKDNILTLAPSWDSAYGLFTAGEVPLVISYTTSPPYHVENDNTYRYKALIFPEGHTMHIEGAGLVSGAAHSEEGKAFLDFLISSEAQAVLPQTQWMYPINEAVALPPSYSAAPKAQKMLTADNEKVNDAIPKVLEVLAAK